MNKKIKKMYSKKGMTLVELLVGIAIVVIVFAGTLGAMVGGYSTTVSNANSNKVSSTNEAVNEIIMNTVQNIGFATKTGADNCIAAIKSGANDPSAEAIKGAAKSKCDDIKFVDSADFPKNDVDNQYTLITDQKPKINSKEIAGVIIKTAMKSSSGFVINQSFVPYSG
ncbi:MAG: prepilin-type N-terminal cleavage/methylation domain-containing protein [Acutalibacteraceae bacterium]